MPIQLRCNVLTLGSERAQWTICPDLLSPDSVIYSVGVGSDVSFDLELIRRFGVQVHAFDPTPRSISWVQSQSLPGAFVFHDYGVASSDGIMTFHPPEKPSFVSYSSVHGDDQGISVNAPVRRLSTIMSNLVHHKIDLLKMDVEGSEYSIIDDVLSSGVDLGQLLVEFHHSWPEVGIEKTKQAIRQLNNAGYFIYHISETGEEYSFRRR